MKVLLINGSPHEKGCTYTALSLIACNRGRRLRRRRSGTGSSGDSGWAFPNLSKYKCVFRAGECQKEAFRSLPFRSFSYLCVPKNWD